MKMVPIPDSFQHDRYMIYIIENIIDQIFRWKEIQYPIKEDQIGNVMEFPSRRRGIMQNINFPLLQKQVFNWERIHV